MTSAILNLLGMGGSPSTAGSPDEPVIELIEQALADALAVVTTGNGYWQTLTVERRQRLGNRIRDGLAIVAHENPTLPEAQAHQLHQWVHPFVVVAYRLVSEADSTPPDRYLHRLRSDIEKAVLIDPKLGLSPNVIDTTLAGAEYFDHADGMHEGVTVRINVTYLTNYGDPYT